MNLGAHWLLSVLTITLTENSDFALPMDSEIFANVKLLNLSDLMRSLVCIEHPDWDGTIEQIKTLGGKAGRGEYFHLFCHSFYSDLS